MHTRDCGREPDVFSSRISEILDDRRAIDYHEAFTIKLISKPKCVSDTSVSLLKGEMCFLSRAQRMKGKDTRVFLSPSCGVFLGWKYKSAEKSVIMCN